MPSLIRIQPQETIPGRIPYGQASAASFGADYGALAQGAEHVQRSAVHVAQQFQQVQDALSKEDRKLNLIETMSALKDEYAARDIAVKSQLGQPADPQTGQPAGLDPSQYHGSMQGVAQQLLQKYQTGLKYADTAAAFRDRALPFLTEQTIKARYEGFKLQQSMLEVRDGVLIDKAINQAVLAGSETEQRAAFGQALDIVRSGVESGRYSGEQGAAKLKGIMTSVDRGTAMRDFHNPDRTANVVDRLVTGTYSQHMSAEEQFTLARTLQTQADADQNRKDAAYEKWFKKGQQDFSTAMFLQATNKTLNLQQFQQDAVNWRLTGHDIEFVQREFSRPPDEGPSDPATLLRLESDTHSQYPRSTERNLQSLRDTGALNRKDYLANLDRLRETREGLQNRGESQQMQAYHDGLSDLQNRLGVPTMWEKLDPVQKKAWSVAQQEYRRRAWPLKQGAENPRAIVEEIAPRFLGTMGTDARMDKERALGMAQAQGYSTPEQVQTDRASGKLTQGKADNLMAIFREMQAKQDIEQQAAQGASQERAKKMGREKP